MRIIENMVDIEEGVVALGNSEPRFADAVALAGLPPLRRHPPGFAQLLRILIGQQLSVAAAEGIWARVVAAEMTTPEAILGSDEDTLRGLGFSRPKVRYAYAMAEAVQSGALCLEDCASASCEDAIAMLTEVKGIGSWTAEIYLMFCVGHSDVFAPKDLALQEGARMLFELPDRPKPDALSELAEHWSPWRAVAARILWSYYHVAKGREGV